MDAHPGGEDGRGLPGEYVARRVARGTTSACARPGGKDGSGLRGKHVAGRRDGTTSTGARPGGASVATRMWTRHPAAASSARRVWPVGGAARFWLQGTGEAWLGSYKTSEGQGYFVQIYVFCDLCEIKMLLYKL